MQQLITLVFIGSFSNYLLSDAQCSGTICALTHKSTSDPPPIECIGTGFSEPYEDSDTNNKVLEWKDAAINPIDGTIWVIYSADGVDKLGTIEDPMYSSMPCEADDAGNECVVTFVKQLTVPGFSGMTFDCEGQLYAASKLLGALYTLPDENLIEDITDDSPHRCGNNEACVESLTYQFDGTPPGGPLFYRISSLETETTDFYTKVDFPPGDDTFVTTVTFSNALKCGAAGSEQIETMVYIGAETSLITCSESMEIFQLTTTPSGAEVSEISGNPAITSSTHSKGLFSYDGDDLCKPDSCTNSPSKHPTTPPSGAPTATTNNPSATPGDDDDDDDDDDYSSSSNSDSNSSDSSDSSGSNDGALMSENDFDNGMYNGNNNDKMSETITVNLSDQSIFNLWGLFGAFTIVNIIAFWCYYYKRNKNKVKFVNEITPPNIDL